ncbi:CU044_5270 family protein [Streptomyces hirsutus]
MSRRVSRFCTAMRPYEMGVEEMRDMDRALQALDPAAGSADEPDEVALQRILSSGRAQDAGSDRSRRPARRWMLATAAAVTAGALGLVATNMLGTAPQPAYAVTPTPLKYRNSDVTAAEVLESLAKHTAKLPDDSRTDTTNRFVQDSWSLATTIDGTRVTSAVIPERRETWVAADGSRKWKVRTRPPQFYSEDQRQAWEAAGAVGREPEHHSGSSGPATGEQPPPQDAAGMRKWLAGASGSFGPGEMFSRIHDVYMDHSFSPEQRAAILRELKSANGIRYRGTVIDRAGRSGAAFSVDSAYSGLATQYSMVFNRNSGKLLSYEEELTGSAGKLNVKTPAVISYCTYLKG